MKKKLLASLLSLTMVFSMMPTTVYAENDAVAAVQEETTEQEPEEAAAEEDISDAEEPASEIAEAMADGARMDLVLTVKDASATISEEAKAQLIQAAGAYQIGQYMDITLFKYMTISGVTGEGQQLHETDGMVTISVKVPDNLINTNTSMNRTYCIVRNHNGSAEILNASFDAVTRMLTFQTNRFSDYAIAYKDTKKPSGSHRTHRDDNAGSSAGATADTRSTITGPTSPKTGDMVPVAGCVMLFVFSLAAATGLLYMRKKMNKN